MERVPMTPAGYLKAVEELKRLKSVERPQNIKDIEEAMAHGDLSENAEYHAAKEKQSLLAGQISNLEDQIGRSEVIDPKTVKETSRVIFSATVTLYDVETEDEVTYQIVGDEEADVKAHRIGISSPIARGLIGRRQDDEVKIKTPKGVREFEIVKIEYI